MSEPIRINKYLSENHYCSRREADRLIENGSVFVNDKRAQLGDKITDQDVVRVNGRSRKSRTPEYTYILLNKPAGIVVTKNRKVRDGVLSLVETDVPVLPVGDMDTQDEGLLILTNDAVFEKKLMSKKYLLDQEFVVEADRYLERKDIAQLQNGIQLRDGMTKPAKVRQIDDVRFAIILQEHRPQLLRRMCEHLEFHPLTIMRTRILTLKMISTYPIGNSRSLTTSEVHDLKKKTMPSWRISSRNHTKTPNACSMWH